VRASVEYGRFVEVTLVVWVVPLSGRDASGVISFPACWSLVCLSGSQAIHA
jgi:hypothetical protein